MCVAATLTRWLDYRINSESKCATNGDDCRRGAIGGATALVE